MRVENEILTYQHMYWAKVNDTIPNIHTPYLCCGMCMLNVMVFLKFLKLLIGIYSDFQHISMLSYLLHMIVHIAQALIDNLVLHDTFQLLIDKMIASMNKPTHSMNSNQLDLNFLHKLDVISLALEGMLHYDVVIYWWINNKMFLFLYFVIKLMNKSITYLQTQNAISNVKSSFDNL